MSFLPPDDDCIDMALEIFRAFDAEAGDALYPENLIAGATLREWPMAAIQAGLLFGIILGLFQPGASGTVRLTEAGLARLNAFGDLPKQFDVAPPRRRAAAPARKSVALAA
jgi:hypothetical protein